MRRVVSIDENDVIALKHFSELPTWIVDEWNEKYGECNCAPLPVDEVSRILQQLNKVDDAILRS